MRTFLLGSSAAVALVAAGLTACGGGDSSGGPASAGASGSGGANGSGGAEPGSSGGDSSGPPSLCQLVGDEVRVTESAGASSTPALVWTGSGYLVAFYDDRSGAGDIYVAALSAEGAKLGPEVAIASTPAADRSASLAAVAGGYVVGWSEQASPGFAIRTRLLGASGAAAADAVTVATSTAAEA